MIANRIVFVLVLGIAACACGGGGTPAAGTPSPVEPAAPAAERVLVNVDAEGVALGGHDPVAYAAEGAPVIGTSEHVSHHGGATYRFASSEHKGTFDGDMARHVPGFGGYCAYAASQGRLSPGDPQVWKIVDGQLLLFTNQEFLRLFDEDPAGHKRKADENWPGLVAQHGRS